MRNKKRYLTCGVDVKIVMQKLKKEYKFIKTIYMWLGNFRGFKECNIGEFKGYKNEDYYFIIFPTDNIYFSECIVLKRRKNKCIKKDKKNINNFLLTPKTVINSIYGYIDTDSVKERDINSTYPDFTNEKEINDEKTEN